MVSGKTGKKLTILAIFCVGLFLSVVLSYLAYRSEEARIRDLFNDDAYYRFKFIEDTVQNNISALASFADFYAASHNVERSEFETFAKGALLRNTSIVEFRWIKRVRDNERAAFELAARESGITDFRIKDIDKNGRFVTAPTRPEYYILYYITCSPESKYDNRAITGFDISGVPEIWDALESARDTGRPAATGEIRFSGELFANNVARMFLPIYKNDAPHGSIRDRRNNLTGFVPMLYNAGELIEKSLAGVPSRGIDLAVYLEKPSGRELLYFHPSRSRKDREAPSIDKDLPKRLSAIMWSGSLSVADGTWLIVCSPAPEFLKKNRIVLPWVVLAVGLALTLILTGYFRNILRRSQVVEALVDLRTDQVRQANREWANTFNAISDFVFILDKDSVIRKVNKAFLDSLKLEEKDVVGNKCYGIVHKRGSPWPNCPHQKTIADLKPHTEEVNDPALGLPLLITTSPIFDDKGEFVGTVHIAKDISVIKKDEEELRKANEQLKKLDELKSDFVSIVSHELRTPLAIMKEGVSLVLDDVTGPINKKTRGTLDMVFSNINRLAKLINDILDISKIEAGKMVMKKSVSDINALASDTAEKWRLTAGKKKQEIIVSTPPDKTEIYLDPDKIIQVLNNLLSNAIKFTPDNGRISVEVRASDEAVEVSVSDTGIGLSKEDLPRVFEKFRQFSRPVGGPGAKGTGLGLAISRELVSLHEGYMKVESTPGAGSKFIFTIPKKDSETIFREHIEIGAKDASADGTDLSIISIRVPDFYELQEEIGIGRAEEALEDLRKIIAGSLRRKEDVVVKGVKEFVVILVKSDRAVAETVRGRVEEAVRSYVAASKDKSVRALTINIGVAAYPSDVKKPEDLLIKARGIIKV